MFKWIKSLFTSENEAKEVEAQPASVEPIPHFHVERVVEYAVEKNGIELPDFDAMTKLQIDIWARNELDINLDRRRTKDRMIKEIHNHLNKEN